MLLTSFKKLKALKVDKNIYKRKIRQYKVYYFKDVQNCVKGSFKINF